MKYKAIKRSNPQNRTQVKYYATPTNDGTISLGELADEIVQSSALSRGDVMSTLDNLVDVSKKYLKMNKSVQLGELGTLRVSFSSDGVDKPEDLHPSKIKDKKVIYTPGVAIKKVLNDLHFEYDPKYRDAQGGGDGNTDGNGGGDGSGIGEQKLEPFEDKK